jgi:DNA-binding GntR family transcriptional regulator
MQLQPCQRLQQLKERNLPTAVVTRTEEAYRALRRVIAKQELPPGTWLRQRAIAAKLGMSPTPLVQAFQRLEHEGLVECVPQWGVRIRALTVHELEQVYRMRGAMESIVFRELASRAGEVADAVVKLRPLAEEVDRADEALRRDVLEGVRETGTPLPIDQDFHLALARLSGMGMIVREIDRLCLLSATMLALAPNQPSATTHVGLLDAILTGDPDLAEQAIRNAIEQNIQHVLPLLRERFGDAPIVFQTAETDQEPTG